ncbi:hypothetical protein TSUD_280350 [Trifolium subterraneum]|uniref:B-like cyclin n=1 Tax=Trifolium subterraneum TaxID=3900 RepID=A0A2Z6NC08_TRISU|nr:hypothetical protein TSUD_280350 [Trifolium subterraneum]
MNRNLTAMNKLLMEKNDRLQKQVSQLVYENTFFRQHTENTTLATTDTSCESVLTSGQQHPPRDASPAGLLSVIEETLAEFLSKATGTAVEWVQMPGMKPGPDSIGVVAISHGSPGVAARACDLVGLEPASVAEILKDRLSWHRDCRTMDVLNVMSTASGGTIELLYMQVKFIPSEALLLKLKHSSKLYFELQMDDRIVFVLSYLNRLVKLQFQFKDRWQVPLMQLEYLADYIVELSLLEYDMLKYTPSLVAASATLLAKYILLPRKKPWVTKHQNCVNVLRDCIYCTATAIKIYLPLLLSKKNTVSISFGVPST